jgi:hypothetical protein
VWRRSLDREQLHRADVWVLGQQLRRGLDQRLRDLARQMRLTSRVGLERVEDPVGDLVGLKRIPADGLLLGDRELARLVPPGG